MSERVIVEHLNQMSHNILRLEILILTLTKEMENQGFVITKEILQKAEEEYEETLVDLDKRVNDELDRIKKEAILSNIFLGPKGEA